MEEAYPGIGGLNEKTLHRQLKELYLIDGGVCEQPVGGYFADVLTPEGIVEIQTGSFGSLRKKLTALLETHRVRLVHPVSAVKMILLYGEDGVTLKSRRRSPKKQTHRDAAAQLLYIPDLIRHPRFSFETILIEEEEIRIDDGGGSWRRRGVSLRDRRMTSVLERKLFLYPDDYRDLLPGDLPEEFTNADLAGLLRISRRSAGQITYLLKKLELIRCVGNRSRYQLFSKSAL